MSEYAATQFAKQFDQEHGGRDQAVCFRGRWYFPDGAWRDVGAMGCAAPVPENPAERAANVARYWKLKRDAAAETFRDAKARVLTAANAGGATDDDVRNLKRMAAEVRSLSQKADETAEAAARLSPNYIPPENRAGLADSRRRQAELVAAIKDIEV